MATESNERRWSFHSMTLASGQSDVEIRIKNALLDLLITDPRLSSWHRRCSYRVVYRSDLVECVRTAKAEKNAYEKEIMAVAETKSDRGIEGDDGKDAAIVDPIPLNMAEMSPTDLAQGFQRLVAQDKAAFYAFLRNPPPSNQQDDVADTEKTTPVSDDNFQPQLTIPESLEGAPARVYLLADYPSSLAEINELLLLGESDSTERFGNCPLLPLIDGLVVLLNPTAELRNRHNSFSMIDEQRKDTSDKDSIMQINPVSAEAVSVFQSANPIVKEFLDASNVGGPKWNDFVFTALPCTANQSEENIPAELTNALLTTIETLAMQKFAFKQWVGSTKMISIPDLPTNGEAVERIYRRILNAVFEASVAVSTVVFAMKEAVAMAASNESLEDTEGDHTSNQSLEQFLNHGDIAAIRLAVSYSYYANLPSHVRRGNPCCVLGRKIDDIEKEIWMRSDLPGVGNSGRKAMPTVSALSETNRSILDTELAVFTPQSIAKVHLTRQLFQMEEVLGTVWKGKLQSREYTEDLNRIILPQRLASVLGNFPNVYTHYYTPTDSLLLMCLAVTAPGRLRTTSWSARDRVRHRPVFKDWKREETIPAEYLTPRTDLAAGAYVPLSSAQLTFVSEKCWICYPADQSIVRLYQTPRGATWLSIYQRGDVFGLRPNEQDNNPLFTHAMTFAAFLEDNTQVYVREGRDLPRKPDKFTTIVASNTFPSGLVVSASSDGSIFQRYVQPSNPVKHEETEEIEAYRVISGKGTVVRVLTNGKKLILLPNGVITTDSQNEDDNSIAQLVVDPETNALVERRSNGVVIVAMTDGARVTYHTDGTRMILNSSHSHMLIQHDRFADVCIDIDVNLTAQKHALAKPVAITKGGLRTRSVVNVYDGTCIEVGYNTKVTAQVNGRVTTRKPNGLRIVAKDSGRVEYYASTSLIRTTDQQQQDDDDRDVTSYNGVYYFDCRAGRFELCDNEHNQFMMELNTEGIPNVKVDLAGVVSDTEAATYEVERIPATAVINDPIEPHVFILNGDGTGKEVLRPRDVCEYVHNEDHMDVFRQEVPLMGTSANDSKGIRVFSEALNPCDIKAERLFFNDTKLREEMERLSRRPVAMAAKYLSNYPSAHYPQHQFSIVRRIEHVVPLNAEQLKGLDESLENVERWKINREANKDQYKVEDPRDDETIAQALALQKKVLAAYKAARSRKKLARQKAYEMRLKLTHEKPHMETVQEATEPQSGDDSQGDSEDNNDFDQFYSDASDGEDELDLGMEIDDPAVLLWNAFSQADTGSHGYLSVAQTRQALVQALGVGVPSNELIAALARYKLREPLQISFDVFTTLVDFFKMSNEYENSIAPHLQNPTNPKWEEASNPSPFTRESTAAGSATEAVRLRLRNVST